jgi:hypothetical protein
MENSCCEAFDDVEKNDALMPIFQDAILYRDENHTRASLGGAGHNASFSRKQYFVAIDKKAGQLKTKSEGGVMPQQRYWVVAKYTTEARGCYGVCCPILINGEQKPQLTMTWDYTGRRLLSLKGWNKQAKAEMTNRRGSKYMGWALYNGENPYLERFGEDKWENESATSPTMRKIRYVHTRAPHNNNNLHVLK